MRQTLFRPNDPMSDGEIFLLKAAFFGAVFSGMKATDPSDLRPALALE